MKKLLIYFVTVFVLFGCSNTKKGVVCKNEVKTHKYKGFNEPYSYQKINSNKIDKIHAQNKTHKLEKEVEYLEEPSYASIDKDHFIVSKDPIKERIRNHKNTTFFTPEPEATAPKTNGLAVAGFVTWLFGFFLSFAGIPFVGFIGAMMAAMSLFQITNNKGKYKGAGWAFVPIVWQAFWMLLIGALFIAAGSAVSLIPFFGPYAALIVVIGALYVLSSAFFIYSLVNYFSKS